MLNDMNNQSMIVFCYREKIILICPKKSVVYNLWWLHQLWGS